jgi:formylglycine-generating enzyme required for sulfatase activity
MSDFDEFTDPANSATYWPAGVHTKLTCDPNLAAYTGTTFNMIGNDTTRFNASFDGNDHTIENLTYTSTATDFIGLFGYIGTTGQVKNLALTNVNINAGTGYYVGGLAGWSNGTIANSYSIGSVRGYYYIGGLVGVKGGTITNSYSTGSVTGMSSNVGGLVGVNNEGLVTNSYSTGSTDGDSYVGGLVGYNECGSITNSYSTGSVSGTGDYVGGLVGMNGCGGVTNSFWDRVTSGMSDSEDGLADTDGMIGLTTTEMQSESTYTSLGWDFTTDWKMSDINSQFGGYPVAIWQTEVPSPGDMGGGTGTVEYPYLIEDMSDFDEFTDPANSATYWAAGVHTKLTCDIDLIGRTYTTSPIACNTGETTTFEGTEFTGVFEGNGHVVTNLSVSGSSYCGLFGRVGAIAEINNLGLENISVTGTDYYVGGLAGESFGDITNVYSTGSASGQIYVGGLIGNNTGTITHAYSTCSITGGVFAGGILGYSAGTVTGSFWDVDVSGIGSAGSNYYGSVGKVTAQLQTLSTFTDAGWDFDNTWYINNGFDYPKLTEPLAGDLDDNNYVNLYDFMLMSAAWSTSVGDTNYNPACDLSGNQTIDLADLVALTEDWIVLTHANGVFVPDVFNITQSEATTEINDAGLAVIATQAFSDSIAAGSVITQSLAAGSLQWPGTDVTLVISLGEEPAAIPIAWVTIAKTGFTGDISKYETTNAQYCDFLNAALTSGDITVTDGIVLGESGTNPGTDFDTQLYCDLTGDGWTTDGVIDGGASRITCDGSTFIVAPGFRNHPVTYVTWYGATAFASYYGYTLPTETQWQAAAQYDLTFVYATGPTIDNTLANYHGSTHPDGTTDVGTFGEYGYGIADMSGNVWEWTSTADVTGDLRIMAGGGWSDDDSWQEVTSSYAGDKLENYSVTGFRVCK